MSRSSTDFVTVGRVGKPHGLDGSFFVERASDDPERFAVGAVLHVDGEPVRVEASKRSGGRQVIRLDRAVPRGSELAIPREALPPTGEGEYYVFQLVGLEVEEEGGRVLGRVAQVAPGVDSFERLVEPLRRRGVRENRPHVILRRGVAVQDAVVLDRQRPALRPGDRVIVELGPSPVIGLAVAVPADEARVDAADEGCDLGGLGPEEEVAAEDDRVHILPFDLGEHGLERRGDAVDVVERRDAQRGRYSRISSTTRRCDRAPLARTIARSARAMRP